MSSAEEFGQGTLTLPPTGTQTVFNLSAGKTVILSAGEMRPSKMAWHHCWQRKNFVQPANGSDLPVVISQQNPPTPI